VGQVFSELPLIDVVAYCARAAALSDPRFKPVRPDELPGIEIEISVLSPLEIVVPAQIEAGKHGLLVSRGRQRGVLLPQVASDFHWTGMRLVEETCEKAGLARDAWKDSETRIEAFTAEVFSEGNTLRTDSPLGESPLITAKPDYSSST
jgi:AmmeMemoRadiSam system protein A